MLIYTVFLKLFVVQNNEMVFGMQLFAKETSVIKERFGEYFFTIVNEIRKTTEKQRKKIKQKKIK